jgi:cell surface protein SprA
VRLWFDGLPGGSAENPRVKVQVASIKILGNTWLERKIAANDTGLPVPEAEDAGIFLVDVRNNKEDPGYESPFDPGEETTNEQRREQSLQLTYLGIPSGTDGRHGSGYKEIIDTGQGRNQDYTQYQELSFYFRDGRSEASGNLATRPPSTGTFFFRFGPDTTNFYEFSGKPPPSGWREIMIPLDDLANLKLDPPQRTVMVEGLEVEYRSQVFEGDTLAVYGSPSLSRVRRLTLGVKGDDSTLSTIDGDILVNEIRLRAVRKDVGYAARASGNARFADLVTMSGSVRKIDSEFRRIEGARHGNNEFSWNVRGDISLNRFFDGRGLAVPLTGDYSYSETTPRLAPNSDVVLIQEQDKAAARTTTRRKGFSTRFSKTRPSGSWLIRYTVDAINLSGSYSTTENKSPFSVSTTETSSGQGTYNLNPGQGKSFRLFNRLDLSYFPTVRIGVNGNLNVRTAADIRTDEQGESVLSPRLPVRTRVLEGTGTVQWDPLRASSLDTQFTFNVRKDLDLHKLLPLSESIKRGSRELRRDHTSRASWRPGLPIIKWFRPVLTYDNSYIEDQSPGVQPPDRSPDESFFRRVENSNGREISTSLNLSQIFRKRKPESGGQRPGGSRGAAGRTWRDNPKEQEPEEGDKKEG